MPKETQTWSCQARVSRWTTMGAEDMAVWALGPWLNMGRMVPVRRCAVRVWMTKRSHSTLKVSFFDTLSPYAAQKPCVGSGRRVRDTRARHASFTIAVRASAAQTTEKETCHDQTL